MQVIAGRTAPPAGLARLARPWGGIRPIRHRARPKPAGLLTHHGVPSAAKPAQTLYRQGIPDSACVSARLILACGSDSFGAGKGTVCGIEPAATAMRGRTMLQTERTDYALCVLVHLAVNGGGLATIGEIAEQYGISRNHLAKVVWELGRAGFVKTVRGRGGGLRLAREAETISIGAVARHTERAIPLAECSSGGPHSLRITSRCNYRIILSEAAEAFFAVLDRYTVGDLVKGNRKLRTFLSSNTP